MGCDSLSHDNKVRDFDLAGNIQWCRTTIIKCWQFLDYGIGCVDHPAEQMSRIALVREVFVVNIHERQESEVAPARRFGQSGVSETTVCNSDGKIVDNEVYSRWMQRVRCCKIAKRPAWR